MTAQLGLGFTSAPCPVAIRERRLLRIARMLAKFDEYDLATVEIARRLRRSLNSTGVDLAELRRRGVVIGHRRRVACVMPHEPERTTTWYLTLTSRPRPYKRRPSSLLPVRLDS